MRTHWVIHELQILRAACDDDPSPGLKGDFKYFPLPDIVARVPCIGEAIWSSDMKALDTQKNSRLYCRGRWICTHEHAEDTEMLPVASQGLSQVMKADVAEAGGVGTLQFDGTWTCKYRSL